MGQLEGRLMPQPQPLTVGKGKTLFVYGVPGAGKTTLVGTGAKTLILRPPDDNTDSIPSDADCEEIVMEDWADMFETFAWLQQEGHKAYQWVWLDSISLMQDRLLESVLSDMLMRRPDLAMDKGGRTDSDKHDADEIARWLELAKQGIKIPEFGADKGDYKINFDRLAKWVRDMVGIAKAGAFNFGMTAHPFAEYDPVLSQDVWKPWIQGKKMSDKIQGYFNTVAYLQEQKGDDGQRVLYIDKPGFVGKDQLNAFPELKSGYHGIIDPSIPKLEKAGVKLAASNNGGARRRRKVVKRPRS
jgi:hypothetical protein